MLVVVIYKKDAGEFSDTTIATDFESLKKRIRLYFKNVGQVKAQLYDGQIVTLPYVTLQRDRRCKDIKVKNERRKPVSK